MTAPFKLTDEQVEKIVIDATSKEVAAGHTLNAFTGYILLRHIDRLRRQLREQVRA